LIPNFKNLDNDIFREYKNDYRIDSTILNQESENYNIANGQQRLTTLAILLNLLEQIFNPLSL